ncbi:hypothetical protein [Methylococcus sp. EFPC2]|uniref:hypothetical protein n=1 Tax=Methylococcus sp. EFPC2 TaxID=2812648 RepID=UPI001968A0F6|nr:hypothetical protein [Methylococcus sp. EFPC2]QSA97988.1 hypothetical protein JWZ97_03930 [Methylococcus sp. EFPC2]
MANLVRSDKAKKYLAVVWFVGAGILFVILVLQSTVGVYSPKTEDVWNWFLPIFTPTLTLIIGILVSDALGKSQGTGNVDRFIYRLTLSLSVIYILMVGLPIFIAPFSALPPLKLMESSRLWLVPFQGLVSASLGAFFVNKG